MRDPSEQATRPVDAGSNRIWIIFVVLVALGGAGAYWMMRGEAPAASPIAVVDAAVAPVVPDAEVPNLPLADGDTLLRQLLGEATTSTEIAKWLSAEGLVRRLTAAVWLVSEGKSPRPVLSFFEVEGQFAVREPPLGVKKPKDDRTVVAPESWSRYDVIAATVTAIDPAVVATIYVKVRPYFESAFAEVSRPGQRFDEVLQKAIDRLGAVSIPAGPVEVVPKGALWAFKDPNLEALPEAEKHLLRMGLDNGRKIQGYLARFADHAGLRAQGRGALSGE